MAEEDIIEMFRFMDWILTLPPQMERQYQRDLKAYEEERKMPAISPFEKKAINKGKREGRQEGALETTQKLVLNAVKARWRDAPEAIGVAVKQIMKLNVLETLHRKAITAGSLEESERELV